MLTNLRNTVVLARPSRDPNAFAPRILRDATVLVGRTATPLTFKNKTAAEKHVKDNPDLADKGFVPMALVFPRKGGSHYAKK
jgi:hypothetical protein